MYGDVCCEAQACWIERKKVKSALERETKLTSEVPHRETFSQNSDTELQEVLKANKL